MIIRYDRLQLVLNTLVLLLVVTGAVVLLFRRPELTFRVEARTEILHAVVYSDNAPVWLLSDCELYTALGARQSFSGTIKPSNGLHVTFRRVSNGPLWLTMQADSAGVGQVLDANDSAIVVGSRLSVKVDCGSDNSSRVTSILFTIVGDTELGSEAQAGTDLSVSTPTLLSAEGGVFSERMLGDGIFEATQYKLRMGERFRVVQDPALETRNRAVAIVRVDESSQGMQVLLSAIGKEAIVTGYGRRPYSISLTYWDRIRTDPEIQAIWVLAGAIYALAKLMGIVGKKKEQGE